MESRMRTRSTSVDLIYAGKESSILLKVGCSTYDVITLPIMLCRPPIQPEVIRLNLLTPTFLFLSPAKITSS